MRARARAPTHHLSYLQYLFFLQTVEAMFGYMTELDKVEIDESATVEFEVEGKREKRGIGRKCTNEEKSKKNASEPSACPISSDLSISLIPSTGHDILSLLYALLDEFLFRFSADDFFVCKKASILTLDLKSFRIRVLG